MQESFKVWVDRLKEGQVQKIEGSFDSSFLDINETDLKFPKEVVVQGEAYLADQHLVLRFSASTQAALPCAVCNKILNVAFCIKNVYHTEALEDLRGALFDSSEPLREALLIEAPRYVECNEGCCPERVLLASYLSPAKGVSSQKKEAPLGEQPCSAKGEEGDVHFPFANL